MRRSSGSHHTPEPAASTFRIPPIGKWPGKTVPLLDLESWGKEMKDKRHAPEPPECPHPLPWSIRGPECDVLMAILDADGQEVTSPSSRLGEWKSIVAAVNALGEHYEVAVAALSE